MAFDGTIKDLEIELQKREMEDPLALKYVPHEKQIEVHKSRTPVTIVLGGNRTGKTWSAVAEALFTALGRHVYAEVRPPPVVIWYVMPSLPMFRRTILPILRKLAPRSEIVLTKGGDIITKKDNIVTFKNNSEIHFLSADMRQRRLQGADVDFGIIDETPDEEVFEELQARVIQRQGRLLLVFAPIDAATYWVRDKLYFPWLGGERPDITVINMPVSDRDGNPLVPYFSRAQIEQMERQWSDPQVRAARMYGEFITRSGVVFRTYDNKVHLVKPFEIPDNFSRWWMVDPQYHRFAALYFAADEEGNYYVTDEFFSQDQNLNYRAERMAAITGDRQVAVPAYVDSANPQDQAELNWHFQRISAPIGAAKLPFAKKVEKMILRTHALLEPDSSRQYPSYTDKADCHGAPRIFFFNNLTSTWRWNDRDMACSRLLWEMQRLSWGKDGKPDKSSADGSDCCDTLIYGCSIIQSGIHFQPEGEWRKKLSPKHIAIWEAIARQDGVQRGMIREW